MAVYKETIQVESHGTTPTYINITPQVKEAIANSGIKNGICTVISPHTTCSVFFEEFVHSVYERKKCCRKRKELCYPHTNKVYIFQYEPPFQMIFPYYVGLISTIFQPKII